MSLFYNTPIILKDPKELIIIKNPIELISSRLKVKSDELCSYKSYMGLGYKIWSGIEWRELKGAARTKLWSIGYTKKYKVVYYNSENLLEVAANHKINKNNLVFSDFPLIHNQQHITEEYAMVLGFLFGSLINLRTKRITLRADNKENNELFLKLVWKVFGRHLKKKSSRLDIYALDTVLVTFISDILYEVRLFHKIIPDIMFNVNRDMRIAFIDGYCKSKKLESVREYRNTNSLTIQQMLFLMKSIWPKINHKIETEDILFMKKYKNFLYKLTFSYDILEKTETNLKRYRHPQCHLIDIEVEGNKIMAGIGTSAIHG